MKDYLHTIRKHGLRQLVLADFPGGSTMVPPYQHHPYGADMILLRQCEMNIATDTYHCLVNSTTAHFQFWLRVMPCHPCSRSRNESK